ncbi:LT_GEWL domain containing protein [uncultured Caudovirales phage]|uniref:LT_GEWL domain containing protein n=1 Tax=uncultured Caudovirales phage TaxID=2100421 RepID=A0A6J7X8J6_9CAUD|nr:LT_GEWL domain containing protein [uncultured Caudovirales phage]
MKMYVFSLPFTSESQMIDFLCEMIAEHYIDMTVNSVRNITPSYQEQLYKQYGTQSKFQINCRKLLTDVVAYNDRVDLTYITCIAFNESRFTYNVVALDGARGIMQVMPSNLKKFPKKKDWQIAVDYLEQIIERSPSECHVFSEYASGSNFCSKNKTNKTRQYAKKMMECRQFLNDSVNCRYFDRCGC